MPLPVFDTQDAVPEPFREEYEEREGKWHPKDTGAEAARALGEERTKREAAERLATKVAGDLKKLETKAAADKAGITDEKLQQIRAEVKAEVLKELEPDLEAGKKSIAENRTLKLDNQVKSLFAKAGTPVMALTLVEAAKLAANEGKTLRASVIAMFARASDLLMALPFKDIQGNAYQYNREGALPGVAFRGVNESYTASTGVVNPLVEALRIAGGDLDVDTFIISTQGERRPRHARGDEGQGARGRAHPRDHQGRLHVQPARVRRLQNRITGSQLIDAGSTDGGDALSLAKLDERSTPSRAQRAHHVEGDASPAHRRRAQLHRRRLHHLRQGRVRPPDDGLQRHPDPRPLLGQRRHRADRVRRGSAPGGGTADGDSIYASRFGDGWSPASSPARCRCAISASSRPRRQVRTRVEWFAGLCVEHGRAPRASAASRTPPSSRTRELLASGDFTADDPSGEQGDSPAAPASSAPELSPPADPAPVVPPPIPTEHSPGVPLVVTRSEDAPPAAPLTLPTTRVASERPRRGGR
jgi:hypothetical protein